MRGIIRQAGGKGEMGGREVGEEVRFSREEGEGREEGEISTKGHRGT